MSCRIRTPSSSCGSCCRANSIHVSSRRNRVIMSLLVRDSSTRSPWLSSVVVASLELGRSRSGPGREQRAWDGQALACLGGTCHRFATLTVDRCRTRNKSVAVHDDGTAIGNAPANAASSDSVETITKCGWSVGNCKNDLRTPSGLRASPRAAFAVAGHRLSGAS
jgi:hypothetical protein